MTSLLEPASDQRTHLAKDIRDVRRILRESGYDQEEINRKLDELIRPNKALGGFEK
jgi:hypothetical protein